jgi:hypothetical protein
MSHLPRYPVTVHRDGRDVSVTLEIDIEAERRKVFDFVAAEGVLPEVSAGYERPVYLGYETSHFTSGLRFLASRARGQWWFAAAGSATRIRWRYAFRAKGWMGSILLPIFARLLWPGYMRVCLHNVRRHFADHSAQSAAYQIAQV